MPSYNIAGEFDFDSTNISSSKGFKILLYLNVPDATREQHIYIKEQLAEKLHLNPHSIPKKWGENAVSYDHVNFDTDIPDSASPTGFGTGDISLIKHLMGLLKEGRKNGFIDNEDLKCNGRRYPNDGDHPLFSGIPPLQDIPDVLRDFASLNAAIGQTIKEAQEKLPLREGSKSR